MWQLTLLFDLMLRSKPHVQSKEIFCRTGHRRDRYFMRSSERVRWPLRRLQGRENWSDASGVVNTASHSTTFPGLTAGYGFDVKQFMIGAEVFADFHHGSTTYKDGGVDLKVGIPFNTVMPYARLGKH
jgi:outer membrane immunogenic protein